MAGIKSIFRSVVRKRSETVIKRVLPYLDKSNKIIDIGSGTGDVAFLLQKAGKNITPVDVGDFHGPRLVKTTIYDGKTLSFAGKTFDTALLLMVLHHTPDPQIVFNEAGRVAKEVVVIETSYKSPIGRFFTILSDTIGNLRLKAFGKSYKSDSEWKAFFKKSGFEVLESHSFNDNILGFIPFLHILYYLKRK